MLAQGHPEGGTARGADDYVAFLQQLVGAIVTESDGDAAEGARQGDGQREEKGEGNGEGHGEAGHGEAAALRWRLYRQPRPLRRRTRECPGRRRRESALRRFP